MVNVERLKTVLRDQNVTAEQASEAIGINPSTFYRKLGTNGEKFTVKEVEKLANLLHLNSRSLQSIFFDR